MIRLRVRIARMAFEMLDSAFLRIWPSSHTTKSGPDNQIKRFNSSCFFCSQYLKVDYSDAFTRVQQQRVDGLSMLDVIHSIVCEIPESFVTNDHHATILKPVVQQLKTDS